MNILHIINDWTYGGISQIVLSLIKNTKDCSHFSLGWQNFNSSMFRNFEKNSCTNFLDSSEEYPFLEKIIKERKIDIIHKQTGGGDFPKWIYKANDLGVPIIETIHCPRKSIIPDFLIRKKICNIEKTVSLNNGSVKLIPPPIAKELISKSPKIADWGSGKKMVIGRIARYESSKDHMKIMNTAFWLLNNFPDIVDHIEFVLMGNPETYEPYYKKLKSYEIDGFLSISGFIENKREAMENFHLCLNPGREELDYPFLESMVMGIPVITSYSPFQGSWICGSVFKEDLREEDIPKDVKSINIFGNEIIRILFNKEWYNNKSKECIEKSNKIDFSEKKFGEIMEKTYKEVLNKRD